MTNMQIEIPVSIGELIDKITILEIKMTELTDQTQRANVEKELNLLCELRATLTLPKEIYPLTQQLSHVNRTLWHTETYKRNCEQQQKFDAAFIEAARNVYIYNDQRAQIKKEINRLTNSSIVEEKSY